VLSIGQSLPPPNRKKKKKETNPRCCCAVVAVERKEGIKQQDPVRIDNILGLPESNGP
jgi:hypothetical protein